MGGRRSAYMAMSTAPGQICAIERPLVPSGPRGHQA